MRGSRAARYVGLRLTVLSVGGLTGVARGLRATCGEAYLTSPLVKYDFHVEDRPELLERENIYCVSPGYIKQYDDDDDVGARHRNIKLKSCVKM